MTIVPLLSALTFSSATIMASIAAPAQSVSPRPILAIRSATHIAIRTLDGSPVDDVAVGSSADPATRRMAWSADGAWLAFATPRGVSVWQRSNRRVRAVVALPRDARSIAFRWAPNADALFASFSDDCCLAPASTTVRTFSRGRAILVDPGGISRIVAPFAIDPSGVVWSVDGRIPTEYYVHAQPPYSSWFASRDEVVLLGARDGVADLARAERVALSNRGGQIGTAFAGVLPGRGGILFWEGAMRSASIAADGQNLTFVRPRGRPRKIGFTLAQDGYVSLATEARKVAFVDGGLRLAWRAKRLRICALPSGSCIAPQTRPAAVTLEPAWSPDGRRIAFVRAAELRDGVWGFTSDASYHKEWVSTRQLWIGDGRGIGVRRIATGDVWWPRWSRDGTQLAYVSKHRLWLVSTKANATPRAVSPPFPGLADDFYSYGNPNDGDDPVAISF